MGEEQNMMELLKLEALIGHYLRCYTCNRTSFTPFSGPCGHTRCQVCCSVSSNCSCGVTFEHIGSDLILKNLLHKREEEWDMRNLNTIYSLPSLISPIRSNETDSGRNDNPGAGNIMQASEDGIIIKKILGETKICPKPLIEATDFTCRVCMEVLNCSVVLPCGHALCRDCLDSQLLYALKCPLCRASLREFDIDWVKDCILHKQLLQIAGYPQISPPPLKEGDVPLLSHLLFPTINCTFNLSKICDRKMIRYCMKSGSKIGLIQERCTKGSGVDEHKFGTLFEVRDVIIKENGDYIVTGIGLKRLKVYTRNRSQYRGFEVAEVEEVRPVILSDIRRVDVASTHNMVLDELKSWLERQLPSNINPIYAEYGKMPDLEQNWEEKPDGPNWIWWALTILPIPLFMKFHCHAENDVMSNFYAIHLYTDGGDISWDIEHVPTS